MGSKANEAAFLEVCSIISCASTALLQQSHTQPLFLLAKQKAAHMAVALEEAHSC